MAEYTVLFDISRLTIWGRRVRGSGWVVAALAVALMTGCQSYSPQPPDLSAHHAAWLERSPNSPEVSAFANALKRIGSSAADPSRVDQLSLADAEIIALVFNPDLRLARSRAGVTQATRDHAGLWDDPVVNAGFERMLASVEHPWEVFGTLSFTLPISGRLEREKQRADAAHHSQLHHVAEQEWRVRMNLRQRWVEWSAAHEKATVTAEFLERLEGILAIVKRMEEVGELARVNAGLFHIELHSRRNDARSIDAMVKDRELALRRLMGLPPGSAEGDASYAPMLIMDAPAHDADEAARAMRERHPRLLVLHAEHTTAERELELQVRRQYPDIVIGPGYGYEDGNNQLLMGVSLPIPIFNRNRQRIAEATAEREHLQQVLEIQYEQMLGELAAARNQFDAADDQLQRMTETIVPLVDQQYADARRVAELGDVDTLLLLDTLRRQHEAKIDLIELEANRSLAATRLTALLGPEESDVLLSMTGREMNGEEARR